MTFKIRINILLLWGVSVDPGCKMWNPVTTIQGRVGWIIQANQQCWHAPTLLDVQKTLMQKCSGKKTEKYPNEPKISRKYPKVAWGGWGQISQAQQQSWQQPTLSHQPLPGSKQCSHCCAVELSTTAHSANSVNNFDMRQHSNVWYPIEMYL